MSSPVTTIADALIAFILSLLRDPEAAEAFQSQPEEMLSGNGLDDVCVADVRSVAPVIVDHPTVTPKPPVKPPHEHPDPVVKEIVRMVNQFTTIDARATIIDQSTNQNIWTEGGDVIQVFDQEAIVASGDGSVAAGEDGMLVDTDTEITTGDISIGNETHENSHNQDGSTHVDSTIEGSFIDNSQNSGDAAATATLATTGETSAEDAGAEAVSDAADVAVEAAAPVAAVPEPAAVLESDMTATSESYDDAGSGSMPEADVYDELVADS